MQSADASWTVLKLVDWAGSYLAEKDFGEARLNAELLLAHVLHVKRLDLYLQFDRPLTPSELGEFKALFKRRLTHEPLQYILGRTEFMGIPFDVDRSVLIPRPETELLVELALDCLHRGAVASPRILDVGTGSGNIAVALGTFCPKASIVSIDVSPEALATARRNVERQGLHNVCLEQRDIWAEFIPDQPLDMIVSNPPYVPAKDFDGLQTEVRDFEPRVATTDEGDGLRYIRRLTRVAGSALRPGGWLLIEIGFGQSAEVRKIANGAGLECINIVPDIAGIPRVLMARRPDGRGE